MAGAVSTPGLPLVELLAEGGGTWGGTSWYGHKSFFRVDALGTERRVWA